MRTALVGCLVCLMGTAWAAPYGEDSAAPAPNEVRAMKAMHAVASGPWVAGDWALRATLTTGKNENKVSVPMEVLGGWTPQTGRWQRIKLPGQKQWIIKGVRPTQVWEQGPHGSWRQLGPQEMMAPMVDKMPLNWEAYAMNFINWPQSRYLGVQKAKARWCDAVELTQAQGEYRRAVIWIDIEFGAPVEAELYDASGMLTQRIRAISMQKTESGEWILRRWEVTHGPSRQKVTIEVAATATGGRWDGTLFDPKDTRAGLWPHIPERAWKPLE